MKNKRKKISDSANLKKASNKNLLIPLLNNKKIFSANSKNFSKNSNQTEETEFTFLKKNQNNELPLMPSSQIISAISKTNVHNIRDRNEIHKNYLNDLLFNSMSFDNFLKEITESQALNNSKINLKKIFPEEKKNFFDGNDSSLNINNNSGISNTNQTNKRINKIDKRYMLCMKKLEEIDSEQNLNLLLAHHKYLTKKIDIKKLLNFPRNVLFRQIILNESSYEDLYYDDTKYLMNIKYYNEFIKTKMSKYKKYIPKEENFHRVLEKEYLNSNFNKPKLTLNSLSISFSRKGKYHLFHIPFEMLPLIYYKNMTYLKHFLINIIRFSNNYEDISLNYKDITHMLCYSKEFEIEGDNDQNKDKTMLLKSTKVITRKFVNNLTVNLGKSLTKANTTKNNKNPTPNNLIKRNKTIRVFNGVNSDKPANAENNEESENLYKCSYNTFIFKWNTPNYEYDVEVKTPEAIFQIGKICFRAFIDIEYIFNFLEYNFENWDFYISKYIFSYKECQNYISEFLSLKAMNNIKLKKSSSQPFFNYLKNTNLNSAQNNHCRNIFLNMEKMKKVSEKSKNYEFIYTDKNNRNYIKILHNYFITARCKSFKTGNKFAFDFSFFQMKILNNIIKIQGLNYFIKKLIYIDKMSSNLKFGYDELNTLANGDYKLLENQKPNVDASQSCLRMKEIYKDIINITITFPFLETIGYDNQNYNNCIETDYNDVVVNGLPLDILDELCSKSYDKWPKILLKVNV